MVHDCDYCNKSFARPDHLRRHQESHTNPKAVRCPFCPRRYSRLDGLRRHCRALHPDRQLDENGAAVSKCCPGSRQHSPVIPSSTSSAVDPHENTQLSPAAWLKGTSSAIIAPGVAEAYPLLWHYTKELILPTWKQVLELNGVDVPVMDPQIVSSVRNDQMNNLRPWVQYESAHQMPSPAVEIHDYSQRNGIDQVRHMWPRRVSNTSHLMSTPNFPSVSVRRNSIMTATIPGPFPGQKSSIDEVLNHIDIKRVTMAYKNYSYPNIPIVHLATYRLFSSAPFQIDSCVGRNKINAPVDPSGRRMPRCLLYPLLALGAGYSLSPSLSQRLFEEAGLEIRRLLRDYTSGASAALPDVIVIQSLMLYIQYCLSSGSQILEQIATQHICSLAALV